MSSKHSPHTKLRPQHPSPVQDSIRLQITALEPTISLLIVALRLALSERGPRVQYPPIVKQHRVALFKEVLIPMCRVLQRLRKVRQGGVEHRRGLDRERGLEGGRVVDELDQMLASGGRGEARELNRRVGVVQMVAVVDVVVRDGRRCQCLERGGVLDADLGCNVSSINEDGGPTLDTVAEAVKDLVARGMLKVSVTKT